MSLDTYYSPEVEQALVSLVWHKPELLAQVYRQLDPSVHILQQHLRLVLEAIDLAYRHLNSVDFATVVQTLREDGRLEDCGDLQGLEALYSRQCGYEALLGYYIYCLQLYATKREKKHLDPVTVFSGGKGTITLNKTKSKITPNAPDYVGTALIRGRKYRISGWTAPDRQGMTCSFYAQ